MDIRFPIILRVVGFIGILHAILGLAIALMVMWRFDPSALHGKDIANAIQNAAEDVRKEASKVDPSVLAEIFSSARFRVFLYSFATFGMIFNILLVLVCRLLLHARAKGVGFLLLLMVVYALYSHALPKLITGESEWEMAFAGAWGIGNMGLSLMLLTYFWLWAPALALVGGGIRLSPNKPLQVPADHEPNRVG